MQQRNEYTQRTRKTTTLCQLRKRKLQVITLIPRETVQDSHSFVFVQHHHVSQFKVWGQEKIVNLGTQHVAESAKPRVADKALSVRKSAEGTKQK